MMCSGCTPTHHQRATVPVSPPSPRPLTAMSADISVKLYQQYRQWQGTPYRLGGLTQSGIDCSGFVYRTFEHLFQYTLPRTTIEQAALGKTIQPVALEPGDLIFFKTGRNLRHVGIYINDGQFLHASTRSGVVISALNNPYWATKLWKIKRIPL